MPEISAGHPIAKAFLPHQRVTTEGKGMSDKQVQLSGKCVLKIDTIKGSSTIEIPKVNLSGKNNADALLNEVFHFGVMRHGKNKLREMLEEKLDGYGEEYENHGLTYD
ncbi:hypothetical protein CSC04_3175 [Enterobacter roggenkampii]|uniref:hypothetical protein n=1 Tax=Enterobacter roggenkampii TaxID=1812935 RepID=UPI000B256BB9|nr:hypothetical protein [Enterobacter roggenkampii]PRW42482.1 hypothetical protein CSC04_3175 [Enterobacter roggenkampii]